MVLEWRVGRLVSDGEGGTVNPFDNATVIIDKAHNF